MEACFIRSAKDGGGAIGFSGGEPLIRPDLVELVQHARELGYYSNLITSGYGLTEEKIVELKTAGLDHIQVSIQASTQELNDHIAGTKSFEHKQDVARLVKNMVIRWFYVSSFIVKTFIKCLKF